jgi:cold-inducible RNA-binding protein
VNNKLYVGNLPWSLNNQGLEEMFSQVGPLVSATVISDRATGRSKGFGFVEYEKPEDATKAVEEFNGKEIEGRALVVNEARPQKPREDYPRN